jgi:hypothetical protein
MMEAAIALQRIQQDLLDLADFGYGRLRHRLAGLTDEEYRWEPAPGCWSVRPASDGTYRLDGSPRPVDQAPLTTIAWRICHIIDLLADDRNATWIGLESVPAWDGEGVPGSADPAIDQLARAYARFRAFVAASDPAALTAPMGAVAGPYVDSTRAAFVLHQLDELIHHAAEVATLRDLYRALRPPAPETDF